MRRTQATPSPTKPLERQHIGKSLKNFDSLFYFFCSSLASPSTYFVIFGGTGREHFILSVFVCIYMELVRTRQHKRHMTRFIPCFFFLCTCLAAKRIFFFIFRYVRIVAFTSRNWIIGVNVCLLSLSAEARHVAHCIVLGCRICASILTHVVRSEWRA